MSKISQPVSIDPQSTSRVPRPRKEPTSEAHGQQGWYLYGITPHTAIGEVRAVPNVGKGKSLETVDQGEIAAVVTRVPLAAFLPEALEARLQDTAWLEGMVRHHNQVISAIHARCSILPAKFGAVYAQAADLRQALRRMHDGVLAQLRHVEGCDEWAVHLYLDPAAVALTTGDAAVQQLEQELASASPGKAYFLQRRLAEQRARAAERAMTAAGQEGYEALASHARDGQVVARPQCAVHAQDEVEVLQAAFLVPHTSSAALLESMRIYAESRVGARWEYSGPLPPYSFAALPEEEPQ